MLDLSHNRIEDMLFVKVLAEMPELRVLVLTGNPIVNKIPSYRKTLIIECVSVSVIANLILSIKMNISEKAYVFGYKASI